MNKKSLAMKLSRLKQIENNSAELEQYQTPSEVAADILWQAYLAGDVEGKVVADLGCGNGVFGIGAYLLGAEKVYFVDVDEELLKIAKENSSEGEFVKGDVSSFSERVDTVIMNPPFGVQNRKADKPFLEKAMTIADNVYSLHKIESEQFISSVVLDYDFEVVSVTSLRFLIKKVYEFHKKEKHYVDVGLWHLRKV
jgi:putative methylase